MEIKMPSQQFMNSRDPVQPPWGVRMTLKHKCEDFVCCKDFPGSIYSLSTPCLLLPSYPLSLLLHTLSLLFHTHALPPNPSPSGSYSITSLSPSAPYSLTPNPSLFCSITSPFLQQYTHCCKNSSVFCTPNLLYNIIYTFPRVYRSSLVCITHFYSVPSPSCSKTSPSYSFFILLSVPCGFMNTTQEILHMYKVYRTILQWVYNYNNHTSQIYKTITQDSCCLWPHWYHSLLWSHRIFTWLKPRFIQ